MVARRSPLARLNIRAATSLIAVATIVCASTLVGCVPAPSLTANDVIGTWTLAEGGEVIFDDNVVYFDDLYVSPLSGTGQDRHFTGSGTWDIEGKSKVSFHLPEWTSGNSFSLPGVLDSSSLKAVLKGGHVRLHIFDPGQEIDYYLKKE